MTVIKRWLIIIVGGFVTVVGLILMPVPGPGGLPVTLAGLAILATELPWAKRLMENLKRRAEPLQFGRKSRLKQIGIIVGIISFYAATVTIAVRIF